MQFGITKFSNILRYGSFILMISSCSSGSSLKSINTQAITMPISSTVCNSAEFSPNSLYLYHDLSSELVSQTCIPAIYNARNATSPVDMTIKDNLANYYYGQKFGGTCPKLGLQSELPIPSNSPYAISQKNIVNNILHCLQNVDLQKIKKPLFVFDVDDTLIVSGYQGLCLNDFQFNLSTWNQAIAVNAFVKTPETSRILQYAFENSIDIAIVTGRSEKERSETENNLITAYPEFATQFKNIFAKNMLRLVPESQMTWTTSSFKNAARQKLIDEGYTILLNVGDQYSDLNYNAVHDNSAICSYKFSNFMYYIP